MIPTQRLNAIEFDYPSPQASGRGWSAVLQPNGALEFRHNGQRWAALAPSLFEEGWRYATLHPEPRPGGRDNAAPGRIVAASGGVVETQVVVAAAAGGALRYVCEMTARDDLSLHGVNVSLNLPYEQAVGGFWFADDRRGEPPAGENDQPHLFNGLASVVGVRTEAGRELRFRFPQPALSLVQDDRRWNPTLTLRFGPNSGTAEPWAAGRTFRIEFELSADSPIRLLTPTDDGAASAEWLPFAVELDIAEGSALDFSKAAWRGPAPGAEGRLIARADGAFAFERTPRQSRRFYGVNLCFGANTPDRATADRLAARLARLGYNAVRLHHHDGALQKSGAPLELNAEALDRMEYLFAALRKNGIFVSTDLYVSRPVPAEMVWPGTAGSLSSGEFKLLAAVHPKAEEHLRAFARLWLGHKNPHTGMTWAEDPALAWISLINENTPANYLGNLSPRVAAEWQKAWNRWLTARYPRPAHIAAVWGVEADHGALFRADPLPKSVAEDSPRGRDFAAFCAETQRGLFERMARFLREELGCRALLTDLNGWTNRRAFQWTRLAFDYVDDHFYADHPEFVEKPWSLPSRAPHRHPADPEAAVGARAAFTRLFGKPFTVSEFNYAAPGPHRGTGGLLLGALAALQDWDGVWRFAYSHDLERVKSPSPLNYFDLASDPLNLAADRLALLLFLRRDARPAPVSISFAGEEDDFKGSRAPNAPLVAGRPWLAYVARVGYRIETSPASARENELRVPLKTASRGANDPFDAGAADRGWAALRERAGLEKNTTDAAAGRIESSTGELQIDAAGQAFAVDTPRFAGGAGPTGLRFRAGALEAEIRDSPAAVAAAALDGLPLRSSRKILVTHLTDMRNTGQEFRADGRTLTAWGRLPHLVRAGRANVRIARDREAPRPVRAWALSTGGRRLAEVPVAVAPDGALQIECDVRGAESARLLYEIAVE